MIEGGGASTLGLKAACEALQVDEGDLAGKNLTSEMILHTGPQRESSTLSLFSPPTCQKC